MIVSDRLTLGDAQGPEQRFFSEATLLQAFPRDLPSPGLPPQECQAIHRRRS